jgi:hypothetical protein
MYSEMPTLNESYKLHPHFLDCRQPELLNKGKEKGIGLVYITACGNAERKS